MPPKNMRQPLICLTVPAVYILIAYTIGVPLPPQPWLTFCILLAFEVPLLYYSLPIVDLLMGSGIKQPEYGKDTNAAIRDLEIVKNRTIYFTGVILFRDSYWSLRFAVKMEPGQALMGETQWTFAFLAGCLHLVGAPLPFLGESDHPIEQRDGSYVIDFASDICA